MKGTEINTEFKRSCLICEADVVPALDFGEQPLANSLLSTRSERFEKYALGFSYCPRCSHGQLSGFVAPELLFDDYIYASGTSNTLKEYFAWFSRRLKKQYGEGLRVLELACNDGSLLDALAEEGVVVMGIDPAANLCRVAASKGHTIRCGYFPNIDLAGTFDCIIAMNVLAHNPDPAGFMAGVADRLDPEGVVIIQTSQVTMLKSGEFDTIYHEHYSFFTLESMRQLAERCGLIVEHVEVVSVHGNSLLVHLRHRAADRAERLPATDPAFLVPEGAIEFLSTLNEEERIKRAYAEFVSLAKQRMAEVASAVRRYREQGCKIALVGVAAKALTFIGAAGLEFDGSYDEAPLKIGKYIPGFDSPIQGFEKIGELGDDVLVVIGAWNFAAEIGAKVRRLNPDTNITFLKYFPKLEIFSR